MYIARNWNQVKFGEVKFGREPIPQGDMYAMYIAWNRNQVKFRREPAPQDR